ncbi:MAG: hypothetical protein JSW73_00245 [Candidatus Woesearchaeota archaeon]|nr:MAG: hypothetical protein JSW73_00245 [Candidatus Woesearchaeota archaeon]
MVIKTITLDNVTDTIIACAIAKLNDISEGGEIKRVPNLNHKGEGFETCAGFFNKDRVEIIEAGENPMILGPNYIVVQKTKMVEPGIWKPINEYIIDYDEGIIDPRTFDKIEEKIKSGEYNHMIKT